MYKISKNDLNYILDSTKDLFNKIKNERIFITGGTGFFGCWLLESFLFANDNLNLGSEIVILTRNKEAFEKKAPHIAFHPVVTLHVGDMTNFVFPAGQFSHIIHAASEIRTATLNDNSDEITRIIVNGTKRVLDFAIYARTSNFLFTSSGAVYGKQPTNLENVSEDYLLKQFDDIQRDAYGEGKFLAEKLCIKYATNHNLQIKIARCFSFIGPYLPLNKNFAIGNFILNCLKNEPIHIKSDGSTFRSYLYGADLTIWLWTILFKGRSCFPYNVGSDQAISISELAKSVVNNFDAKLPIIIDKKPKFDKLPDRYVPSVQRAKQELDLKQGIDLSESIIKTKNWYMF